MGIHSKTYIKCSQIHKNIQFDNNKISKGKLNPSQQNSEGDTPYDPTILKSLRYIKIVPNVEHERERERGIKHIATGTYPQP